jgi:hypothetical protein
MVNVNLFIIEIIMDNIQKARKNPFLYLYEFLGTAILTAG